MKSMLRKTLLGITTVLLLAGTGHAVDYDYSGICRTTTASCLIRSPPAAAVPSPFSAHPGMKATLIRCWDMGWQRKPSLLAG